MQLKIHPNLIFRTPRFSYNADLNSSWDELKAAISISSDAFYQTIKDVPADELQNLPPKILFTIWKYFNRARFRSTPYGTFASFSFLKSGGIEDQDRLVIQQKQDVHAFVDWPFKNQLAMETTEKLKKERLIFSNNSFYLAGTSIRYIACTDGVFELAEIDQDDLVLRILNACLKPIQVHELLIQLFVVESDEEEVLSFLADMLDLQLLFSDLDPNIIGEDYFQRIDLNHESDLPKYIIAERKVKSGTIDQTMLKPLPALIHFLQKLLPLDEHPALSQFVQKFKKRFDQQEVPLLLALDPEMGVGYDELEHAGLGDEFAGQFGGRNHNLKNQENLDALKKTIREKISAQSFKTGEVLQLDKITVNGAEPSGKLPNSFSVVCSFSDGLICLDQIGGSTANALSGRFTLASTAVELHCKEIADIEQDANPGVLFFDVAYLVETNVDNVNRRKLIYDRQLSILNYDTSQDPLSLGDIMVSVRGNEVVLRSKTLNQRMVPKMASAYNYTRSDLSVFRLLCDLQHQGLQSSLNFSLEQLFPDLSYYPRVQFQNIIVNNARWLPDLSILKEFEVAPCRNYLKELGLSRYFKTGLSDQTLCFDVESDVDLMAFLQHAQKQKRLVLEEVLLATESLVRDEAAKPYLAQYVFNVYHSDCLYPKTAARIPDKESLKRFYPPGSEWLYFEIYCHQQRSDTLLNGPIAYFLQEHHEKIKSWFFIRYLENGYHIRFRILLNQVSDGQTLTAAFSDGLEMEMASGLVSDLQIKSYHREIERYGPSLMEQVEDHFQTDSQYVLTLLETNPDALTKYVLCAKLILDLQKSKVFETNVFEGILKLMSDSFNREHQLDASDYKKLNAQYQLYKKIEEPAIEDREQNAYTSFFNSFIAVLKQSDPEKTIKLFSDLIHMHVNRLFNANQRSHEMAMYYFVFKEFQRKKAMGS